MINELIFMDGYGLYVWSAFFFTLISFTTLFLIIRFQLLKEQERFYIKFKTLNIEKVKIAKSQNINKEILLNTSNI